MINWHTLTIDCVSCPSLSSQWMKTWIFPDQVDRVAPAADKTLCQLAFLKGVSYFRNIRKVCQNFAFLVKVFFSCLSNNKWEAGHIRPKVFFLRNIRKSKLFCGKFVKNWRISQSSLGNIILLKDFHRIEKYEKWFVSRSHSHSPNCQRRREWWKFQAVTRRECPDYHEIVVGTIANITITITIITIT